MVLLGPSLAAATFYTSAAGDTTGSVSALGDVDGDRLADFGLEIHSNLQKYHPLIVYGSNITGGVLVDNMGWSLQESYGIGRGANLTAIGDINGDKMDDFAFDMPQCGYLRVLLGSTNRNRSLDDGIILSPNPSFGVMPKDAECTRIVVPRALGDINGDLIDDFGVGLPLEANSKGRSLAGKIIVVFGNKSAEFWISRSPAVVQMDTEINIRKGTGFVIEENLFNHLGSVFGAAGDVNGDEIGDLFIGMPDYLDTQGRVIIIFGRNDTADCVADTNACWSPLFEDSVLTVKTGSITNGYELVCPQRGSRFGSHIGKIGDIDGDGSDDLIIGMPVSESVNPTRPFSGSVVVLGSQQMHINEPVWDPAVTEIAMDGSRSLSVPEVSLWTKKCGTLSPYASCAIQKGDSRMTYTVEVANQKNCAWMFIQAVISSCGPVVSNSKCSFTFTTLWNSSCTDLVHQNSGWATLKVSRDTSGDVQLTIAVNNSHGNTAEMQLRYSLVRRSKTGLIVGCAVGGAVGLVIIVAACIIIGLVVYKRRIISQVYRWEPRVWHFEESLRPPPPSGEVSKSYALIAPGRKDAQFVMELYQRCSVPGYEIAKVEIIYSPHLEQAFANRVSQLQARTGNPTFLPRYEAEGNRATRSAVRDKLMEMARKTPEPAFPNVKLIPMWHGTRSEVLESVFQAGFANLATTDEGFFGKGVYSTYEARYAWEVYSKGALLVNWVSFFSAYPVVDGDMEKLTGKGCYANYDAHFIPVRPASSRPGEQNYVPCSELSQVSFHELVTFEASQNLPQYLVTLQPIILTTVPSLMKSNVVQSREAGIHGQQHPQTCTEQKSSGMKSGGTTARRQGAEMQSKYIELRSIQTKES